MKATLLFQRSIAVLAFVLSGASVMAQWSPVKSIYGGAIANDGAFAFSLNNRAYVGGGSQSNELYAYDSASNSWELKGTIPAEMGHAFSMFFTVNNMGYVIGGDSMGYPLAAVWAYDPAGNSWDRKADFPGGNRDAGFAFSINNNGYVGGGFDGSSIYNDIWKYDAPNDAWTPLPNALPISGVVFPSSFTIGGKAYVTTGGIAPAGVNEIKSMWEFDPATNGWAPKTDFPGTGRQAAFAFSNGSYGYVGGGQSNYNTIYKDMWRYNPAANSWTAVENAPLLGTAWATAIAVGNSAYIGLGAAFAGTGLIGVDSFFRYDMAVPTGIATMTGSQNSLVAYPNPAGEHLYLAGDLPEGSSASIFDLSGRLIRQEDIINGKPLFTGDLAKGAYLLRITNRNGVCIRQFVKQ